MDGAYVAIISALCGLAGACIPKLLDSLQADKTKSMDDRALFRKELMGRVKELEEQLEKKSDDFENRIAELEHQLTLAKNAEFAARAEVVQLKGSLLDTQKLLQLYKNERAKFVPAYNEMIRWVRSARVALDRHGIPLSEVKSAMPQAVNAT